ncbi:MAG: class I SAM-dependent methyltransferase [Gammaproteobacteria bacterium]|nr:class I SAM-dependent methyltransferase [Gammaproteobacteria bacterium]
MSNRTLSLTDDLYAYLLKVSLREDDLLRRLRDETLAMPQANMQISPEQGQFMALLVKLIGARNVIEVGTFTGYSSLCVARELPEDGRLVACDVSAEWTSIAQKYWREAGVHERIDLRIAPATETLQALSSGGGSGNYDFAFIDADKESYREYFELCLGLLRPGGVIAVDNTLWDGAVIDEKDQSADTKAIRLFNEYLADDERIDISLVPIGDGLTLARKR